MSHRVAPKLRVTTPDAVINHYYPESCASCGAALTPAAAISHAARQVFDLPEPRPPAGQSVAKCGIGVPGFRPAARGFIRLARDTRA